MAIVRKYRAKVEKFENPVEEIYTVTFSSDKKFKYLPGQFLHLALDEYDGVGQWPQSRCFSMQSSPEEENLKITFAVKGAFTTRMKKELTKGKDVWLKLPYGDIFQRGHNKNNCVFIAGGTGITPFLSLFNCYEFNTYLKPKIYLGFRSKHHNIFNNEIGAICNNSSEFIKFVYQDTEGILNIKAIFIENGLHSTYFISGPPTMIKIFRSYLEANGVHINNIITDDWE